MSLVDFDGPGPHHPIPPHSCQHCQRIVLRREHFIQLPSCIKLPHTKTELRQAIKDRCEFILLFASPEQPEHLLVCSGCSDCGDQKTSHIRALARREYTFLPSYEGLPSYFSSVYDRLNSLRYQWEHGGFWIMLNTYDKERRPASLSFIYHGRFMTRWMPRLISPLYSMEATGVTGEAVREVGEIIPRSYNIDGASESSLVRMSDWLTECHSSHTLCRQEHVEFTPHRLLQIAVAKDEVTVRLTEDRQGVGVKWAALSYVWGGDQSFKSTVSSVVELKAAFGVERLPQTLKDAVTVCRGLSLEFLWVDSLCIIQDDPKDVAQELASMPQIYRRAWVTISASTAAGVSDGFLQRRCYVHKRRDRNVQIPISLPYLAKDSSGGGEIIFLHSPDKCDREDEPINKRAWTYQERHLSPRVLDFKYNQVVLYCYTNKRCEGAGSLLDWYKGRHDTQDRHCRPYSNLRNLPKWHDVVEDYRKRRLSFPLDTLTALSAIADLYKESTGHTYLAGLWKETLIYDLCWSNSGWPSPRPVEYRAPSWSWAAVDRGLILPRVLNWAMKLHGLNEERDYTKLALVVDVSIEQNPPNTTFGKIYDGFLTITAPVMWIEWHQDGSFSSTSSKYSSDEHSSDSRLAWDSILPDGSVDANVPVLAVLLMRSNYSVNAHYYGLLLVPASPGKYRRVGMLSYEFYDGGYQENILFYSGFETQTITII